MECALTSSDRPVLVLVVGKSPVLFERLRCGTDDSALFSMATMLKMLKQSLAIAIGNP